ncbi:3-phosphoserine/phosphohydroxythreonine transaminase [Priestia aryabhattai]|uniref:3-phosphoserine/phosphohydroxythreonine transaminase n=1 Tax=Priestia aryabhattai TaxID=412384 RepID=UPI00210D9FBF|nr:3-phosphoserine/phosphohydroxythreonine transaminase [Priestia aryabhattai]MCQ9282839.1 3-phosphoserine/phosphohydroxythreonine transaminase [Priestia aryabhattai]
MITLNRAYNFNAGPSALPLPVLQLAQEELVNFKNTGMSVMELSHRSKEFEDVLTHAKETLTELLNIPDTHEILFLQGGASLQFSMIPMNFLAPDQVGAYVLTGSWSEKALKEAKKLGKTAVVASTKEENYRSIPALDDIKLPKEEIGYLHITSNNTIFGTQWADYPSIEGVDLIADMSSDILCRQIDVSKFSLIYAGAQKNLGPSGVTVVILKKELLKRIPEGLPTMLNYETHVKSNSLYNTPPTFGIYMLSLVLDWIKEQGGVKAIEAQNHKKAKLLYASMERSNDFYTPHATEESRSIMNVTFTLPNDELTAEFLQQAKEKGFVGLAGHRSIGGCRASIYNAVPLEACEALAVFMDEFAQANA